MPRRALGALLLVVTLLTGLLGLTVAGSPSATAAVGPYTSWSMRSDPGDYILGGKDYAYDATSGMQLAGTATRITGSVDGWNLSLEPADGDLLQAGRTYTGATRTPFHAAGEPGLELIGHGRGCNELTGRFTLHDLSFDLDGNLASLALTFEQHCEGGAPAAYGSVAWHSSVAASPLPPSLSMELSKERVKYGTKVTVQAQLSADSTVRELAVYTRVAGGSDRLVQRASVDAGGRLAVRVKVLETTTVLVRFQGGGTYPDREASAVVAVSGKLRSAFLDKAPKRGKFRLFKASGEATVGSVLLPNHAGDCIRYRLQGQLAGTWGRDVLTKCLRLNKHSAVGVRIPGDPRVAGVPIRIRPEWKGDRRNTGVNGAWLYLKFVR